MWPDGWVINMKEKNSELQEFLLLLTPILKVFAFSFILLFLHRLSKLVLFCWLVLENKTVTKLSLSVLYSLTTILRSKQNWVHRRSNNRLLYCRTFLGPFPNSHWAPSSLQSLWLMLSDQDVRLHHKTSPAPQAFYSEVIWFRWLREHWEERLNTQGDS